MPFTQALILAFDQTCCHDESERDVQLAGGGRASRPSSKPSSKPRSKRGKGR